MYGIDDLFVPESIIGPPHTVAAWAERPYAAIISYSAGRISSSKRTYPCSFADRFLVVVKFLIATPEVIGLLTNCHYYILSLLI